MNKFDQVRAFARRKGFNLYHAAFGYALARMEGTGRPLPFLTLAHADEYLASV